MEQAQADVKQIVTNLSEFGSVLSFRPTQDDAAVTIAGLFVKIHQSTDTEGNFINSVRAHASISESSLTDQGYVTRDANNRCILKDHLVSAIDSTGLASQYIIAEIFPDERVGLIVCMLKYYEE